MKFRSLQTAAFHFCVVGALGCSQGEFPLASVSGVVTLDGKPLPGARVQFQPVSKSDDGRAGPGSMAITDGAGQFELATVDGDEGAVIGNHRVKIRTREEKIDEAGRIKVVQQEVVPLKYNGRSELTMEVPSEGTDSANFTLSSDE